MKFTVIKRKYLESVTFDGPRNSFVGSIWCYFLMCRAFSFAPLQITCENGKISIKKSNFWLIYSKVVMAICSIFIIYSHFCVEHEHKGHPLIIKVTYFQLVTMSLTALIGIINLLTKCDDYAKV